MIEVLMTFYLGKMENQSPYRKRVELVFVSQTLPHSPLTKIYYWLKLLEHGSYKY
jgi:hypothetical protein